MRAAYLPLPECHTHAATGPTDHAVDAGAVAWHSTLRNRASRTLRAATTIDHAVDAGPVAWTFNMYRGRASPTP